MATSRVNKLASKTGLIGSKQEVWKGRVQGEHRAQLSFTAWEQARLAGWTPVTIKAMAAFLPFQTLEEWWQSQAWAVLWRRKPSLAAVVHAWSSCQPNFPYRSPPPPPPTSSCKRKSPYHYQLRCQDCCQKEAASRIEETDNDWVKEKLPESEKNYLNDPNEDSDHEIQSMQETVSFQCDQCKFRGVSDKQCTRIKNNVFQGGGNITESEDKDSISFTVKSETINEECFKALGASEKCAACNKWKTTWIYEHILESKSQCYQNTVSNIIKYGFETSCQRD